MGADGLVGLHFCRRAHRVAQAAVVVVGQVFLGYLLATVLAGHLVCCSVSGCMACVVVLSLEPYPMVLWVACAANGVHGQVGNGHSVAALIALYGAVITGAGVVVVGVAAAIVAVVVVLLLLIVIAAGHGTFTVAVPSTWTI